MGLFNGLFVVLTVSTAALPRETLRERVRAAFRSGDLTQEDYLSLDSRRGTHQYNDCLILQMITSQDVGLLDRAFSPRVQFKEREPGVCAMLRELTLADANQVPRPAIPFRYSRYWHGYNPVAATLLQVFELATVRWLLKIAAHAGLVVLIIAAGLTHRGLLGVALAISVAASLFWGLPYFGPSLSHAPGDICVIVPLALLLFAPARMSRPRALIPFCAAYGAALTYLELLIGLLPTAVGLLVPLAYLITTLSADRGEQPHIGWRNAAAAVVAFAIGAAVTVATKQALALGLTDPHALTSFSVQLRHYTAADASEPRLRETLHAFVGLLRQSTMLTYGSRRVAVIMYAAAVFGWLAAVWLALRRRRLPLSDFVVFVVGAGVVAGWVLVFPKHTIYHTGFMVRIMIVPISLGWAALAWQWAARDARRDGASGRTAIA